MASSTLSPTIESRQQSYIRHEWTISQHRLHDIKSLENCQMSTKFFFVPSIKHLKYGLSFGYKNDSNNHKKAGLQLVLQNVFPPMVYDANIFVSIKSAKASTEVNTSFDYKNKAYTFLLCDWDKLFHQGSEYFNADGELIVKLEGIIMGGERTFHFEKYLLPVEDCLKLYNEECDEKIHINVENQKIWLHFGIYEQLFRESMHRYLRLIVSDFSYRTVNLAVKFGYHPCLIYPATVEELLQVKKFFDIYASRDTIDNYADFLLHQIDEITVCRFAKYAYKAEDKILKKECHEHLIECIQKSIPILDFELLPKSFALELLEESLIDREWAK